MTDSSWRDHCEVLVRSMESEPPRPWTWRLVTAGRSVVRILKLEGIYLPALAVLSTVSSLSIARPFVLSDAPLAKSFAIGAAAMGCALSLGRFNRWVSTRRGRGDPHWGWSVFGYCVVTPATVALVPVFLGSNWRDSNEGVALLKGMASAMLAWFAIGLALYLLGAWRLKELRWLAWGQIPDEIHSVRAAIHGRDRRWWSRRSFLRWASTQPSHEWTPSALQSILAGSEAEPAVPDGEA